MTIAGSSNSAAQLEGGVGVVEVVVGQLLALQLRAVAMPGRGHRRWRRRRRAGAGSRRSAASGAARRQAPGAAGRAPLRSRARTRRRSRRRRRRCAHRRRRRAAGAAPARCRPPPPSRRSARPILRRIGHHRHDARGSSPPRGSSPGRRCRCSRCTSRDRRPRHRRLERVEVDHDQVDRRDAVLLHRRRDARAGRAGPSMPPWTCGCSVFTRPSRISGKPVSSDTSTTASPASCSARAVPPVDRSSAPPRRQRTARSSTRPDLVGDGQQRAADGKEVGRGHHPAFGLVSRRRPHLIVASPPSTVPEMTICWLRRISPARPR